MVHYMNLWQGPFSMIRCGAKTIELRLLDEKRRLIKVGDTIIFRNADCECEDLVCTVKALYTFNNFEELYRTLPLDKCGYTAEEIPGASYLDMEEYYSPEKQSRYGVVGIEIELRK